jgi:5'-3' exonuclease
MGIFRYFRYLTQQHPACYTTIKKVHEVPRNTLSNSNTKGVDCLLFDLNAIIHPCFQKVFDYGGKNISYMMQEKKLKMSYEELEKWAFNLVTKKIEEIVYYNKPTKAIYIAIDGVAGASKSNQQRQRRFKNATNPNTNPYNFDPNSLTCGTEVMDRLCKHIFFFIKRKKQYEWNNLKIFYSDMYVHGEGENKLKLWIEQQPYNSITIVSPDGDVIMLALLINKNEVYIFRENIFDNIDGDYFLVDIIKFKTELFYKIGGSSIDSLANPEKAIKDYVLFHFFIGNDFLPHIPTVEIGNQGIETLYHCYTQNAKEGGFLIEERLSKVYINKKQFVGLLEQLEKYEIKMLLEKHTKKCSWPDRILADNIIIGDDGLMLNFKNYRKEYYTKKLKLQYDDTDPRILEKEIKCVCEEYITGLVFVLRYYFKGIPTYSWYYPCHYAPLITDLAKYAKDINFDVDFKVDKPLNVYESLFGILPFQSFHLLPSEITEQLPTKIKLDANFDTEFDIDLDGKMYEYEGICLLSFLTYDKIKGYFKNIKLSDERVDKLIKRAKLYMF